MSILKINRQLPDGEFRWQVLRAVSGGQCANPAGRRQRERYQFRRRRAIDRDSARRRRQ